MIRWQCPEHEVEWTTHGNEQPKCWIPNCEVKPEPAFFVPQWALGYSQNPR